MPNGRGRRWLVGCILPVVAMVAVAIGLPLGAPGAAASPAPVGLPDGVPPAAQWAQSPLPVPAGWPFPDVFSPTSGTGHLADGAFYWTDFLFDDHGAKGIPADSTQRTSPLAASAGTYAYPATDDDGNGADIFTAAVGLTPTDSYWRVDWTTLTDPSVPIAEWALDTDDNAATGTSEWAAGAGVDSPGIEEFIVVSSRGAWLIDAATGTRTAVASVGGALTVTMEHDAPGSFVVRIPRAALPVSGTWRIRLASGLADASGQDFAPVSEKDGALPGQPAVYNVTFRTYQQEPAQYDAGDPAEPRVSQPTIPTNALNALGGLTGANSWMDADQATALAHNNVSAFSQLINWSQLADRVTTPIPQPTGFTDRWYVSSIDSGAGVSSNPAGSHTGDAPDYRGRVQPYAVYVPTNYVTGTPTALTWFTHSLDENFNQYGTLSPNLLVDACQDRDSICATPEGFGPDGWMIDEAETDFWQVWHALSQSFTLNPNETVISGYSMGGYSTYKLGLEYPDLFAEAMALAGPSVCGVSVANGVNVADGSGRCSADGNTAPLVGNARWLPFIMADGVVDELVPISGVLTQIHRFDQAGERYQFFLYPAEDHLVYATQDQFSQQAAALGDPTRTVNPPTISYTWYPDLTVPSLGLGPTGVYWIRDLSARHTAPGTLAGVVADSAAIADPAVTVDRTVRVQPQGLPTPDTQFDLTWRLGAAPPTSNTLSLDLTDVATLAVVMTRAGFADGQPGTISLTTDGPTILGLTTMAPGTPVRLDGAPAGSVSGSGGFLLAVPAGTHTVSF